MEKTQNINEVIVYAFTKKDGKRGFAQRMYNKKANKNFFWTVWTKDTALFTKDGKYLVRIKDGNYGVGEDGTPILFINSAVVLDFEEKKEDK